MIRVEANGETRDGDEKEESPLSVWTAEYTFPELRCAWLMSSSTRMCHLSAFGLMAPSSGSLHGILFGDPC